MQIRNGMVAFVPRKTAVLALASTLAMSACVSAPTPGRFVQGPITAFGSVFVNGVEYNTNGASILIDGVPATEADLGVGMMVTMGSSGVDGGHQSFRANGQKATGSTDEVIVNDEVEGEVTSNNVGPSKTGTMDVMGQTVTVDVTTVFESNAPGVDSVDQVGPGMIVEVHGHADGRGNISATRIEVEAANLTEYLVVHADMEVKGVVSNLDTTAMTFSLGGATVDYSGATVSLDEQGGLDNGQFVEVKSDTSVGPGETITATKVEVEEDGEFGHQGQEGEDVEMHGETTGGIDANDNFEFDGDQVHIDADTVMEGIQKNQITVGTDLEVKAVVKNGTLTATFISAGETADQVATGVVTNVTKTGINSGTVEVQGVVIEINNETIMNDTGTQLGVMNNIQGLNKDDTVEVDYYTNAVTGVNVAVKIDR